MKVPMSWFNDYTDITGVTPKEYDHALTMTGSKVECVENMGENIQNVVTDTETTAKEAIEYLKRGKFGRATFLPLSSIANKTGFSNLLRLTDLKFSNSIL